MTQFLRLRARNGGTSGKSKLGAKDTLSGTHKTTRNAYVGNVVGVYLTSITQRPAFPVTQWPSRGLAAHSCAASHGLPRPCGIRVPSFVPGLTRGTSSVKLFP